MIVNDDTRTIDFSKNPSGDVDVEVMSMLRTALENNDVFNRLIFDNNRLSEESIGMLAAIIKGPATIEYLSLSSCGLRDIDVMHLSNAICAKRILHYLILSKNPGITSKSAGEIARIVRVTPYLRSINLTGTSLQATGCRAIVSAAEQNLVLEELELPYTVGFKILEAVKAILDRNNNATLRSTNTTPRSLAPPKKEAKETCVSPPPLPDSGVRPRESTDPWAARPLPQLVVPGQWGGTVRAPRINDINGMDLRNWIDPAVKTAAVHLLVLDKRCNLLKEHKEERRRRFLARRGIREGGRSAQGSKVYASFEGYRHL